MELVLAIIPIVMKYGPEFASALVGIAHKATPTLDDWNKAFDLAKNPVADVSDMPAGSPQ